MIYVEVISGLWLGDIETMSNKQFLQDQSISLILNCCHPLLNDIGITVSSLSLTDDLGRNLEFFKQHKDKLLNFIHQSLDTHNILIACYDGQTTSAFLVCLYLIHRGGIQETEVKSMLLSKHPRLAMDFDVSWFRLE